jgi:hypothetical protein
VYCTAANIAPTINAVVMQNNMQYSITNTTMFSFQNLMPLSKYSIYCITQSLSGSASKYVYSSSPFVTKCCKTITAQVPSSLISSNGIINIFLSHNPSTNVSITAIVRNETNKWCQFSTVFINTYSINFLNNIIVNRATKKRLTMDQN